jgi:DNA polymerase III subunit gamma/tau
MSEYIVSARKYRPQTFDTVVGQQHITTTLKNAIRNQHLAHAYLFCGPRGVGKTTCARILAKTINCENPTEEMEACGVCPICASFGNNTSFNVFELDAASNNSVDDIRELTNQVRFAPQHGRYKVYIIDEVHMLSAAAFNAFLKTLEEPPPYAIFILATTEKHKILPTILSRCQIFDFKRITTADISGHLQSIALKEHMSAQEAALHIIAQKSEGCMRDALSMLDRIASFTNGVLTYNSTMEHLNLLDADFYFSLTDNMLSQDVAGTLLMLDNALEKGFEGDVVIGGLAEHFRNLLLCKDARMVKLLDVPSEHKSIYFAKANQAPPSFILSALNVLNQCELEYRNATNRRLHVEMCLIRLCYLLQALKSSDLNPTSAASADDVKKKSTNVATATNMPAQGTAPQTAPANIVSEAPLPTAMPAKAMTPVAATVPAPQSVATKRLSKGLLDELDAAHELSPAQEAKQLTQEVAERLFDKYRAQLKEEGKSVLSAQFEQMSVVVYPPDELRIVCTNSLADINAKNHRTLLQDSFRAQLNMIVRITTELRENDDAHPVNRILSKSEMFEAMVAKNPLLLKLKEVTGMQLEY